VEVAMLLGNKDIHEAQAARILQLKAGLKEDHPDIGLPTVSYNYKLCYSHQLKI
jgi:hypothetical protein